MRWLVTGGAGFIGSHFCDLLVGRGQDLLIYDSLTYASNIGWLYPFIEEHGVRFERGDICDRRAVESVMKYWRPHVIVNFAAESHVDNSYRESATFTRTNVDGTVSLLEGLRETLGVDALFVQISTDEVYGDDQVPHGRFSPLSPQNPYAATKAAAEYMTNAFTRSFDLRTMITRSSNNWGPRQHSEKFIPAALRAKRIGKEMVVHGYSLSRDWLHVYDNVRAIYELSTSVSHGLWNIATGTQHNLSQVLDRIRNVPHRVSDERPGVDLGYTVDAHETWEILGWRPTDFMADDRWEEYVGNQSEQLEEVHPSVLLLQSPQTWR